jgi:hypothetical protein
MTALNLVVADKSGVILSGVDASSQIFAIKSSEETEK